ncbi:MAG: dUTP diphosphatase [Dehalococcoidia bacterium]
MPESTAGEREARARLEAAIDAHEAGSSSTVLVRPLRAGARIPQAQTEHASGLDLHACLEDGPMTIGLEPVLVPTGLAMAVPPGIDAQIRPRSGLSSRGVLAILGTLDADYRGEIFVTLYCLPSAAPYEVQDGDRIAQLVLTRLEPAAFIEVEALDDTARGAGGHGSTGTR